MPEISIVLILLRHLTLTANIIASAISLGSRRVKPDINFLALFLSVNAALPKFVLVLPGHISETLTLEPLSSILKLCAILWIAPF